MKHVFWLVVSIEDLPKVAAVLADTTGAVNLNVFGFEAAERRDGRIYSGGREEFEHCGRYLDPNFNQAEWTKSLEFNNAYINLATFINRVSEGVANEIASEFNYTYLDYNHAITKVDGHWVIDGVWPPLSDDDLAKETYHYAVHGSIPQPSSKDE